MAGSNLRIWARLSCTEMFLTSGFGSGFMSRTTESKNSISVTWLTGGFGMKKKSAIMASAMMMEA